MCDSVCVRVCVCCVRCQRAWMCVACMRDCVSMGGKVGGGGGWGCRGRGDMGYGDVGVFVNMCV